MNRSDSITSNSATDVDLTVRLGRLTLPNPILVASGTFGYAREMQQVVPLARLGGMIPKTVTRDARAGNHPWRTVETSAGLLNSIGLDNDGLEMFIEHHVPYLSNLACPIIASVAGKSEEDFLWMAERLNDAAIDAIELNVSCPNVSGGVDFGTDPVLCHKVVAGVRQKSRHPILAKLTPNVTDIRVIAKAAAEGGADGVSVINTLLGMAVNWRKQKPMLGNVVGGLSGPAIKPVALRCVHQIAQAVKIPIVGIGGIANLDDVMEFLVAGASAVQIGTANFYDPTVSVRILDQLPAAIESLGYHSVQEVTGTLRT
ncbi:MAG: dihydroorotate dehydrogenase [Planctomycetales bacterium]|nr:dihydroorotate dehydrogenase [Planctomycetales bacterium]